MTRSALALTPVRTMQSPDPAVVRLGAAVKKRRKLLGLTQEALARAAGCGLVFVYNLERGKPSLRLDKLLDILRVLGMDMIVMPREHEGESSAR
jgi:HTH-type transcriptional regulator / antitoxin HipB